MLRLLPLLLLAACQASPAPVAPAGPPSEVAPGVPPRVEATLALGTSVEGRPIRYMLLLDPEPDGAPLETVLILATIHGDECAGTPLVEQLAGQLLRDPSALAGRRVVLLPVANPDGFAADRRANANGVDLNRNFDSANWGSGRGGATPLSEPEARAVLRLMERYPPDRVVSIHQPVAVIDHDGPAADYAAAVAAAADLPVRRIGSRPGSLGSYVGLDLGLPILTVELPRGAEDLPDAELWERYGAMMLTCLRWSPGG